MIVAQGASIAFSAVYPALGTNITSIVVNKNGALTTLSGTSSGIDANRVDVGLNGTDTNTLGGLSIVYNGAGGAITTTDLTVYDPASFGGTVPTPAQIATAIWTDLLAGGDFGTAASIGKLLADNINATVSSRAAPGAQMDLVNAPNATAGAALAGDLLNLADGIETGFTLKQILRLVDAALAGKLGISGNTVTIRDVTDAKARIIATTDSQGQRTAVSYDVS